MLSANQIRVSMVARVNLMMDPTPHHSPSHYWTVDSAHCSAPSVQDEAQTSAWHVSLA